MTDRIARLRNHELNIERYQGLLKTRLSDIEQHYIEKRLSEERFSVAMLQFMAPNFQTATRRAVASSRPLASGDGSEGAWGSASGRRNTREGCELP